MWQMLVLIHFYWNKKDFYSSIFIFQGVLETK